MEEFDQYAGLDSTAFSLHLYMVGDCFAHGSSAVRFLPFLLHRVHSISALCAALVAFVSIAGRDHVATDGNKPPADTAF